MFAIETRKETAFSILLIAAIFFNAFAPLAGTTRTALAQGASTTATPPLNATETATETVTETPTDSLTPSPSPIAGEGGTSTPVATDASTTATLPLNATPTPSTTAAFSQTGDETSILALFANPDFITPGGNIMLNWEITDVSFVGDGFVLKITIPETFTLQGNYEGQFDDATRTLTIPVTNPSGQVRLKNEGKPGDAYFGATLFKGDEVIAKASLLVPLREQFVLEKSGGKIEAMGGRIKVEIPKDALPEKAVIEVGTPNGDAVPKYSLLGKPFEIKAHKEKTGEELRQFTEELSITVSYADLGIPEQREGDLHLYWYDTEREEWAALPTAVNRETKTLTAFTDHFTVFDIDFNHWQASQLPTVDSFQVSEFTGAGTYSYPIEAPPGPGGFQPSLALTYNSQIVDQSTLSTQASWVGMGWSLDTGYIELDTHGTTPGSWAVETHLLNVGGVSARIVKDPTGAYHATDENFWKITFSGSTWTVWDKQGNIYYFDEVWGYPSTDYCYTEWQNYRWLLKRVTNNFGQEILYTYKKQEKDITFFTWLTAQNKCQIGPNKAVTAVYPETITYAGGKYRIRFDIGASQNRYDFTARWDTDFVFHTYEKHRLQNIYVEQDADGNGAYETILRRYQLSYAADTDSDIIFPGYAWTAGGKTTTLRSVREYGVGGTAALPATTFTYGDNLHLTRVENGYGGVVSFNYGLWYYPHDARDTYTVEVDFGKYDYACYFDDPSPWYARAGSSVNCGDGSRDPLNFRGTVAAGNISNPSSSIYGVNQSKDLVRPGGTYKLTASIILQSGMSGRVGLFSGYSDTLQPISSNGAYFITLPANAATMQPVLEATGGSGYAAAIYFKLQLLPSVYRVTAKQVSDGNGHTYTYTYSYLNDAGVDSAGVNDAALSPNGTCNREDTSCNEYIERFSEFRGHSKVTMTGPDGTKTISKFHQDDALKGRPISITTHNGARNVSAQIFSYTFTTLPIAVYNPCGSCLPYRGLGRYWVYANTVEKRIYANDGSYSATRTLYTYDSTYGNVLTETEQSLTSGNWMTYRTREYNYYPNDSTSRYLVSLPARIRNLDAAGNVLSSTVFLYDNVQRHAVPPANGVLTAIRNRISTDGTQWSQVSYGYDIWGNRTSETTYSGYGTYDSAPTTGARTTTTAYDPVFHVYPVSQTTPPTQNVPQGLTTTWAYDYNGDGVNDYILGVPTRETGPNGNSITAQYDAFGRMTKLIRPGDTSASPTISIAYTNGFPFTTTLTQKSNSTQSFTIQRIYDGMGRQTRMVSGGVISDTVYFSATETHQSMPYFSGQTVYYTKTIIYPSTNTTIVTAPDDTSMITVQDGLTTTVTDARSNATITVSDIRGRVVLVDAPEGPDVEYTYDDMDRLTKVTRGGATTTISYDHGGRKTSMSDADMGTWTYAYDALGSLVRQTDARGQRICLYYDNLNRLTGKHYRTDDNCPATQPANADVTYSYDVNINGIGRRTGMTDPSGSTAWSYDERGRLTSESKTITGAGTFNTSWTYNSADLPISMAYPDGEVITYDYNNRMLLNSVIGTSTYVQSTTYDSTGRIDDRLLGNGLTQNYSYYGWNETAIVDGMSTGQGGRLKTITVGSLQDLSYLYDAVGNIRQITNPIASETNLYGYDALNRLTSWDLNGVSEAYTYDPATGNLQTKAGTTLQYNDAAHVHAVTNAGSNTYSYDPNGSQTTRTIGGQIYTLGYDAENRLVSVSPGGMGMNAPLTPALSQGERGQFSFASYNLQPLQQSGFPTTSVLDTFNRANGSIGNNWSGYTSAFAIASNKLDVTAGGYDTYIFWKNNNTPFGADQEAYVTLAQVDGNSPEQSLLLKSQSSDSYGNGVIEVLYNADSGIVQVWTFDLANGWVQRGGNISVLFNNGDQFGARAKANGDVEVYKNGSLLATRSVTGWQYASSGGYIGLWFADATNALLDDFGGGNVTTGPTPTVPASATPTQTATPSP
ncbi:MAG: hypothetical protein HUU11_11275, partial [Anaerolineales bacterium]|nr:hypothetical protein [Anaerolineales bacterium]